MPCVLNADQFDACFEKIEERFAIANREGNMRNILEQIGWSDIWDEIQSSNNDFHTFPSGKIVVLGGSECPENRLLGVAKELGLDKKRFEFCLDYEDTVRYDYRSLQYQAQYRVILAGPIPHKTSGTGEYASLISKLEHEPGFPKVIRLTANQALKITKSNFKAALEELLDTGYLVA